ncbi:sigma-70 family RNA polymerase sigma factor [Paractinoplanes atraurantiacus]|uniref:RNA polymerase sigma factor, sigma-70 family n=1 Tax=Paractinoplanes atraurantiacus TaxID=1036182 RepID=A0A285HHP8_9ACTN|nr:RNA polymerase sigma factor, sigma-70 family [Actinoplanes atraurantiacus]
MDVHERFEANRPRLRAVAHRMLGSTTEAEDAVQEAWLRLDRTGPDSIDNLDAWLTTVVGRVCLDMLRSRTTRREDAYESEPPARLQTTGPEQETLLADSVGLALMVVLETLSPVERLAFVLHDLFAVPFDEIAPIVGRSPDAARQLASRARRRIQSQTAPPSNQPGTDPQHPDHPLRQDDTQPQHPAQPQRRPGAQPQTQPQRRPAAQPQAQPQRRPAAQPQAQPQRRPAAQPQAQPQRRPSTQPQAQAQPHGRPGAERHRTDQPARRDLVDAFLAASRAGDFVTLLSLLDPDVRLRVDDAGRRLGAPAEVEGSTLVAQFFSGRAATAVTALINGTVGIAVAPGGKTRIAVLLTFESGRITAMEAVADPAHLSTLTIDPL